MALFFNVQLFSIKGAGIRIFKDAALRHSCLRIALLGAVGVVATAVGLLFFRNAHEMVTELGIPAAMLSCAALPISLVIRHRLQDGWLFDRETRRVSNGEQKTYAFADFSLVRLDSREVHVSTPEGNYTETRYALELVKNRTGFTRELKAVRKARGKESDQDSGSVFSGLSGGGSVTVSESTDSVSIWRLAEGLALELGVPVLDEVGEKPSMRWPDELNLPLIETLGRVVALPRSAPPAPDGASLSIDGKSTELVFRAAIGGNVMIAVFATIPGIISIGKSLLQRESIASWAVASIGVCALVIAIHVFMPRRSKLSVDREAIRFNPGWGFRRRIPQARLEAVRVTADSAIALMSDERIVFCVQRASGSAPWMYAEVLLAIERIREQAPSSAHAYR